jgi:nucleotide-binding universal stress UspA family protein
MFPEIKKILYATDLSDNMRPVFRFALSLAEKYQAKISMLHAAEPLSPQVRWALETYMSEDEAHKAEREGLKKVQAKMRARLAEFCQQELGKSPEESQLIAEISVISGRAAETITKKAEDWDADIVVVGTHTDPSLGGRLLGSTARKVTQLSKRPVLVVPVLSK